MSYVELTMALLLLPTSGGNDLLDYVATDAYWKSKEIAVTGDSMVAELGVKEAPDISALIAQLGDEEFTKRDEAARNIRSYGVSAIPQLKKGADSTNAEVASQARRLIERLGSNKREIAQRRLMAIRALGELKHRDAVTSLRKLVDSKEPFVAEYAQRAIGAIEGKPTVRPGLTREQLDEDVWLLPKNCGVVAQLAIRTDVRINLDDTFKRLSVFGGFQDGGGINRKVRAALATITEQIGNARIDAITLGLADGLETDKATGRTTGFGVVIVRGVYDRDSLLEFLKSKGLKATSKDGIEYVNVVTNLQLVLVSNERLLVVAGPPAQAAGPISHVLAGKGRLADNERLSRLIRSLDRPQAVWMAATFSATYKRDEKFFEPFDVVTAVVRQEGRGLKAKLVVTGSDPESMKASQARFEVGLKETRSEFDGDVDEIPALKPLADLMNSIKHERSGADITVTGEMADTTDLMTTSILFSWYMALIR